MFAYANHIVFQVKPGVQVAVLSLSKPVDVGGNWGKKKKARKDGAHINMVRNMKNRNTGEKNVKMKMMSSHKYGVI